MMKKAGLEALLFSSPDPVSPDELARALALEVQHVRTLLHQLQEEYEGDERGFFLEHVAGGVRLASKPDYANVIEELGKAVRTGPLSKAAIETLAIIAYRQPITRPQIESIRGVKVGSALTSLSDRGLIEERGRAEGLGRPILYGTTPLFLVRFGLNDLGELPDIKLIEDKIRQQTKDESENSSTPDL